MHRLPAVRRTSSAAVSAILRSRPKTTHARPPRPRRRRCGLRRGPRGGGLRRVNDAAGPMPSCCASWNTEPPRASRLLAPLYDESPQVPSPRAASSVAARGGHFDGGAQPASDRRREPHQPKLSGRRLARFAWRSRSRSSRRRRRCACSARAPPRADRSIPALATSAHAGPRFHWSPRQSP